MVEVVRMQQEAGINRFKCATIAEAEMLAMSGVSEILVAYPLVGPAIGRFLRLMKKFPEPGWWTIGEDDGALCDLDEQARDAGLRPNVLIDVNMGADRTGVSLSALEGFYQSQAKRKNLRVRGLHCYDGNVRDADIDLRKKAALPAAEMVLAIRDSLKEKGMECDTIVLGGSPTTPCHAGHEAVFLSPGTIIINDHGYTNAFADLDCEPAAAILARVISRPRADLFTLDLGYKAIGADPKGARGIIVSLPEAFPLSQSEEHWVFQIDKDDPSMPRVGQALYVIPTHVCSTTALYSEVVAIQDRRVAGIWQVRARNRKITV
jgi:D-serine deaminase-like pyridoxal phosphate-dependent protein